MPSWFGGFLVGTYVHWSIGPIRSAWTILCLTFPCKWSHAVSLEAGHLEKRAMGNKQTCCVQVRAWPFLSAVKASKTSARGWPFIISSILPFSGRPRLNRAIVKRKKLKNIDQHLRTWDSRRAKARNQPTICSTSARESLTVIVTLREENIARCTYGFYCTSIGSFYMAAIFRCVLASLCEGLSVRMSVRISVSI